MTLSQALNQLYWQKDADYMRNYANSIGCKNQSGTVEKIIDLENRTIYGNENAVVFKRNLDGSQTTDGPSLSVSGMLQTPLVKFGDVCLSCTPDNTLEAVRFNNANRKCVFELKTEEDFADLTEEQKATCQTVATLGDFAALENKTQFNKERLICVLDVLKYVPELSGKTQEIEDVIDSLNNGG